MEHDAMTQLVVATGPDQCWTVLPPSRTRIAFVRSVGVLASLVLLHGLASAQSGSGIAGVVTDSSGAVLPGVAVEAASPALIEKTRTVVTDGDGQYKIVGLVPGLYTVRFTLFGFSTVVRDGVELTASFTASVNADMRVGSLEETITVTGAAPTVDIQNVVQQRVMTREVIDAIPAGTKMVASLGVLIPGVVSTAQDVGGTSFSATAISVHGGRSGEQQLLYDGVLYHNGQGAGGQQNTIVPNDATVQEVSLELGGTSAESPNGGVRSNIIPKDGGNTFKGSFFSAYTNDSLQAENLSDALKAKGLLTVPRVTQIYDVNPALGGPLKRDTLWFFGSVRKQNVAGEVVDRYYNLTPTVTPGVAPAYTPDFGRPADANEENGNVSLRFTWQVNQKNKVSVQGQHATQKRPHYNYVLGNFTGAQSPEATWYSESRPDYLVQAGWNSPLTSRVLLEASAGGTSKNFQTYIQPGMDPLTPSWTETNTGVSWGNYNNVAGANANFQFNTRMTASYVTGSHAAKVGVSFVHASSHVTQDVVNNGMTYQLSGGRNAQTGVVTGVPLRITLFDTPKTFDAVLKADWGIFAQDQWTIRRLTLNVGVRYDSYNAYVPAQHLSSGPQVPGRSADFARVENVPNWKDVSPRLGAAYDLFGTGKTALKVTLNRYVQAPLLTTIARAMDPANAIRTSATRTWNDSCASALGVCGDFIPQPSELGPINPTDFGQTIALTQAYSDEAEFDPRQHRGYNWEGSASIQQELIRNMSVNVAYFRRWYGNQTATQNIRVTNADFTEYCVTAPNDPRLPTAGSQLCGLYDRKSLLPAGFSVIQLDERFGGAEEVYDGVDINTSARMGQGLIVQGGVSLGRTRTNNCFAVDDVTITDISASTPRIDAYCDVRPPFQPNVKALVVYPLPWWGMQASATYQGLPGPQIAATTTFPNSVVAPFLGRNLVACGAAAVCNSNVSVNVLPPGTLYGDRMHQVDFRVSKSVRFGNGRRVQGMVDVYNLSNSATVLAQDNNFSGGTWQRPTRILQARLVKFGVQLDF